MIFLSSPGSAVLDLFRYEISISLRGGWWLGQQQLWGQHFRCSLSAGAGSPDVGEPQWAPHFGLD